MNYIFVLLFGIDGTKYFQEGPDLHFVGTGSHGLGSHAWARTHTNVHPFPHQTNANSNPAGTSVRLRICLSVYVYDLYRMMTSYVDKWGTPDGYMERNNR